MQAQLLIGAISAVTNDGGVGGYFHLRPFSSPIPSRLSRRRFTNRRSRVPNPIVASTALNGNQNHYVVLGLPRNASSTDIKTAYRHLARKCHPDVSKDPQAHKVFMSIQLAYETLNNVANRTQYDKELKFQEESGKTGSRNHDYDLDFEDRVRIIYRWAELRRQVKYERYQEDATSSNYVHASDDETDELPDETTPDEKRGPFMDVLTSAFISMFLVKTFGPLLALTFTGLMALSDKKLDAGYKLGYLIAWIMGGRAGVLLTMCLSFASWVCGKTSSSVVVLVVVAMWVATSLARYASIPQGALLTLLYMSLKLQADLNRNAMAR